ncbi:unnamed protein product [Rotaria socialis]
MASSSLYFMSITVLVLIFTVESVYYAYTYDDGFGGEEHCCLVRTRETFCMAKPITRSLIQVKKQCHRMDGPKHHRGPGGKNRKNQYLDKIIRRLDVKSTHEIGDKILIELKHPLEKKMLDNDLMCLKSTSNEKIDLEKCHVELVEELNNAVDDDDGDGDHHHMPHKQRKHRRRPGHGRHNHSDRKKRIADNNNKDEDSVVNKSSVVDKARNEKNTIELDQPIHIREGHGFTMHQTYKLHPSHVQPNDRQQRACWTWYRRQTQKLRRNPSKHKRTCIHQNDHNEHCINQLVYNTLNVNSTNQHYQPEQNAKLTFSKGSKLYCDSQVGSNKLLGHHRHSEICFQADDRLSIEHKFTDITGLSDMHKNKDVLAFIAKNEKLTAEFNNDCHDDTTLSEIAELEHKKVKTSS